MQTAAPILGVLAAACLSTCAHAAEQRRAPPAVLLIDDDTVQFGQERIAVGALAQWNSQHRGALCPDKVAGLIANLVPVSERAVQRARKSLLDAGCERVGLVADEMVR